MYNASIGIEELKDIPKIFFLNHCRGNGHIESNANENFNEIEPKVPKTILVYASS